MTFNLIANNKIFFLVFQFFTLIFFYLLFSGREYFDGPLFNFLSISTLLDTFGTFKGRKILKDK